MFLGGGELTWKLPASPGASPEPSAHPHICPIGHQLHDCDVTRYSVPPTAPPPAPRQPHRISGERAGHFVDCYQKREVSITSFSDTCALSRSFSGPAPGPVEILIGKKSWLEEIMDAIDIQRCSSRPAPRREWESELNTLIKDRNVSQCGLQEGNEGRPSGSPTG